jgi:hypothetical protein
MKYFNASQGFADSSFRHLTSLPVSWWPRAGWRPPVIICGGRGRLRMHIATTHSRLWSLADVQSFTS